MAIFEMDPTSGTATSVEPLQPASGSFEAEVSALVSAHLPVILGERLLAVAHRRPGGDDPLLVCIDQDGRPLVVDICPVLDPEALVRALRHAGMVARLTTDELGRLYPTGPEAFVAELLAFRDSLPASVAHGTEDRRGTRLVLLCADVDEAVADAVTFLRHGSSRVEVFQVGVVRGAEGRRLLEVAPLAVPVHIRRAAEPSSLRLVRSHDAFAAAMAYDADRAAASRRGPAGRRAATGDEEEGQSARVAAVRAAGGRAPTAVTPVEYAAPGHPAESVDGVREASAAGRAPRRVPAAVAARAASTPVRGVPSAGGAAPESAAVATASLSAGGTTPPAAIAPAVAPPVVRPVTAPDLALPVPDMVPVPDAVPVPDVPEQPAPIAPPVRRTVADPYSPDAFVPPPAVRPPGPPSRLATAASPARPVEMAGPPEPEPGTEPDVLLAEVARELAEAIELVWIRERRGERLTATLRSDGLIQLPDGSIYADPSAAAGAASGSARPVDGWRVWHLGDDGPSLVEVRNL